jgi:hypothetical protein
MASTWDMGAKSTPTMKMSDVPEQIGKFAREVEQLLHQLE